MSSLLYISNQRMPTEKAYGIQIAKMCEAFALQGADVKLLIPTRKNPNGKNIFDFYGIKNNFKYTRLFSPDFYLPGKLDKIAFLIKNFISALILSIYALTYKADIIFSRDELPIYFLSFFRKNLVFEAHKFSSRRHGFYRRFKKSDFKIIVISKGVKDEFVKFGFKTDQILVAHDGVDLEEFALNIDKADARKKTGLPSDKKIILYSGQLFEWKGAGTLLEAAKLISNKNQDLLFVFVGGIGHDIDKFRKKAEGLSNILIIDQRPHKEIPLFLKSADVLVLPNKKDSGISEFYTSPLKLFEYMASERPIVASELPSLREILNENNSVLVSPDDALALAHGITKVLTDDSLADRISKQSFDDVQKYSWQARAGNISDFMLFSTY